MKNLVDNVSNYENPQQQIDVCPTEIPQTVDAYNLGVKINFHNDENQDPADGTNKDDPYWYLPDFDWSTYNSGFDETVQNTLTDTLTTLGSDTAHPDRGSEFQEQAIEGAIISQLDLKHAANFAAESVRTYINQNIDPIFKDGFFEDGANAYMTQAALVSGSLTPTLRVYHLSPSKLDYDSVQLEAYLESSDGQTVGTNVDNLLFE